MRGYGLRAHAIGVGTAVSLVTAYTFLNAVLAGCAVHNCLVPLSAQVELAFLLSLFYALVLSVCVTPIWITLDRIGLANFWSAFAIGFFAPATLWTLMNLDGHASVWSLIFDGLPYALCGGAAGLAVWLARCR